ncbi:hypothetical protein NXX54_03520 [Bacteroides sp. BFG-638]|uniref:Uncharacterized protein n=1 Tax=Bacteroides vicugnae TaxID=3037989 RepID=A0ABU5HRY2_9BACE|nr:MULTISPECIES: hypothetical protein [Bacteroides]MCS2333885.1 hypothetical protein [Bacteroides sp. BFG-606]MCS2947487.1 hypothetical protein [Bacteroides sp. BFG-638]MCS3311119.1 hypothetical protein [Bacteroides sp. BFG-637]MDC2615028.1 hypothetical protein [Bacteroides ovatus]MDY7254179.1 hypothetical protein [Bacteroides sp. A1-P5]
MLLLVLTTLIFQWVEEFLHLSYAITIDWSQKDEFTVEKSINSIIKKSLNVLSVLGLKSIAFPVIATRAARYSLIEHTCFRIP